MSKFGIFLVLIAILLSGGFFLFSKGMDYSDGGTILEMMGKTFSEPIERKAKFEIYTLGTKRIFTDSKYHNLSPFVFVSSEAPDTITVKKKGITWGDFFDTLPMKLTPDCLTTGTGQLFCSGVDGVLNFYINGVKEAGALDKEINEGDELLVEFVND